MRFNVYVDGFNLYYGALRGQPYRWLNLRAFAQRLVRPTDEVHRIRYFTALVRPFPNDPEAPSDRRRTGARSVPSRGFIYTKVSSSSPSERCCVPMVEAPSA